MLVLFLDESGCDNLNAIDPCYPILGIGGPVFDEEEYFATEDQKVRAFKRQHLGSDKVILHTSEINRRTNSFACLNDPARFDEFIAGYARLISDLNFSFISRMIDPTGHRSKYINPFPPYELVMALIMESFIKVLFRNGKTGKIYAERRGNKPDGLIRGAYRAVKERGTRYLPASEFQRLLPEDIHFLHKRENSSGLQIADTTICPVTATVLGGHYKRRDFCVIKKKFDQYHGLKGFPSDPRYWSFPPIP